MGLLAFILIGASSEVVKVQIYLIDFAVRD